MALSALSGFKEKYMSKQSTVNVLNKISILEIYLPIYLFGITSLFYFW